VISAPRSTSADFAMADPYIRPYIDANVYIAMLQGSSAKDPEKARISAEILYLGERGELSVHASTFIEAEVIKPPGEEKPITPEQEAMIEGYFDKDFIVWLEVDRVIARKARKLARDHGMKPPDAVHVATALRAGCDQFLTWDEKLHKGGRNIEGLVICEPHLAGRQTSLFPPPLLTP
jgi:predicted nucleic acid-binding protein